MKDIGYTIECSSHNYITLKFEGKFVRCFDNDLYSQNEKQDCYYAENIIRQIERRTHLKISEIPIIGSIEDFDGLRFLYGGFKKGCEWLNKNQELKRGILI